MELGPDAEKKAAELLAAGWQIDVEVLQHTDEASLTCSNVTGPLMIKIYPKPAGDADVLAAMRMSMTGLVEAAHRAWVKRDRVSAAEWDAEKDDVRDDD
jgi:hypothetical protein